MKIKEISASSILTDSKLPASDYCLNPYVGCSHRCLYCYARFMRRFTKHPEPWGEFVDIRINAPELLSKKIKTNPLGIVLLGSVTDCYQPIEKKYEITRKLLKILVDSNLSVSILTKSDLVLRDLNILKKLHNCEVGLTVTSVDDAFCKIIEPCAPPVSKRIKALQILHDAGIVTYGFIGPIFPGITPLPEIIKKLAGKVDFIMCETINIKGGNWKELSHIMEHKMSVDVDLLKQKAGSSQYWDEIEKIAQAHCDQHGIILSGFFRHDRRTV